MSQGANDYPIQQFLRRLIQQYGPTPDAFVRGLGYDQRIERGLHRLGLWLETGVGHQKVIRQIAWKYPQHAAELQQALQETDLVRRAEAWADFVERCKAEAPTFKPFLHAHSDNSVPNGICIFGMTGGFERWTHITIPAEVLALPIEDQLPKLPPLMLEYRQKHNGYVPFFGPLRGFKFVRLLDHYQFGADGQLVEYVDRPYRHGTVGVSLR